MLKAGSSNFRVSSSELDDVDLASRAPSIAPSGSMRHSDKLRTSLRSRASSFFVPDESVRRVSVRIAVSPDEEPETYTFILGDPIHDENSKVGRFRNKCGKIINAVPVQFFLTTFLILNAILLGVLTVDDVKNNPNIFNPLSVLDTTFLVIFSIELLFQIVYLGPRLIRNSWLVFDVIVIVLSWAFMGSSFSLLRSFRIFRIFVLVSKWGPLQNLFRAVGHTVPQLASIWAVLLLFFYVYMVMCTNLYAPLWEEGYLDWDYFGNLEQSFVTLFQMMTLDSWHGVVRQVMDAAPLSWLCFYSFVIVTTFIFLNLMIAVICEALIELKTIEKGGKVEDPASALLDSKPVNDLVKEQAELIQDQLEMKRTLEEIIKLLPPES